MSPRKLILILLKLVVAILSVYAVQAARKIPFNFLKASKLPNIIKASKLSYIPSLPIQPTLMTSTTDILEFLDIVENLKIEKRTGWHKWGIPYDKTESIADHMYRMSIMVCMIQDDSLDKFKAVKMALVHDMAEALVGDITPDCGIPEEEKNRLETEAMDTIRKILGNNPFGNEAQQLWQEYAADITIEAKLVKDVDKAELILKAIKNENMYGINFQVWITRSRSKIRHPGLQAIVDAAELNRPVKFLNEKNKDPIAN